MNKRLLSPFRINLKILMATILTILLLGVFLLNIKNNNELAVTKYENDKGIAYPNVLGLPYREAMETLKNLGFINLEINELSNDLAAQGIVIGQSAHSYRLGDIVPKDTQIDITISK
ncbi:PASTA domain-containing protein [Cohnella pontilimi]|uniref:PASTA domain-containing protein n=1 Tax=Cohnella pontilimi TaxID=2564100 RepID=A0A4U0FCI3_9BACL|nr:PASTA domain-containing protein [Cohnella pontilimi]TJY42450.1 PASTA domain-containing protein [Cohnella pontilimi]